MEKSYHKFDYFPKMNEFSSSKNKFVASRIARLMIFPSVAWLTDRL